MSGKVFRVKLSYIIKRICGSIVLLGIAEILIWMFDSLVIRIILCILPVVIIDNLVKKTFLKVIVKNEVVMETR